MHQQGQNAPFDIPDSNLKSRNFTQRQVDETQNATKTTGVTNHTRHKKSIKEFENEVNMANQNGGDGFKKYSNVLNQTMNMTDINASQAQLYKRAFNYIQQHDDYTENTPVSPKSKKALKLQANYNANKSPDNLFAGAGDENMKIKEYPDMKPIASPKSRKQISQTKVHFKFYEKHYSEKQEHLAKTYIDHDKLAKRNKTDGGSGEGSEFAIYCRTLNQGK